MKTQTLILIMAAIGLFSCRQANKSTPDTVDAATLSSVNNIQSKKTLANYNDKDVHTEYEYNDSKGKSIIIQNSFPRGGMKYTDVNGEVYNYAIFWTQITNLTDSPLELKMDVPVDSYEIPSLPGKYYKVLIPADTMTLKKFPLFNYGLTNLNSFLDKNIHKSASLRRTINPKESNGFYFVTLCLTEGAHGTIRTGLSLKGQNLFYRIKNDGSKSDSKSSDQNIHCGSINLKNMVLKK
ncbi:hypothetical protein [Flavobacterium sp. K5-23]|uniref:hypothetical protein n=1 Tax=Flavobacterium sp. K5-23 TaxID=2746225 RepID=UPI00200BB24A|nr:hypothetical protein [Flavobacterium sp. K5-23]UQD56735.1 hypothetical protein FLAK523_10180 [Flavobacterium sp. K5-23]